MSPPGRVRTPSARLGGCTATARAAAMGAPDDSWLALPGGRRACRWPLVVDVAVGCGAAGPRRRPHRRDAAQIRALVARLTQAGQWRPDDPPILFVVDAGYDVVRLSWLLGEIPVRLLGRVRADRVVYGRAGRRRGGHPGRPPRHGQCSALATRSPTPCRHRPRPAPTTASARPWPAAG